MVHERRSNYSQHMPLTVDSQQKKAKSVSFESIQLTANSKAQRNSNETLKKKTERYSNVLANTNTNSLVHSYIDEPLDTLKQMELDFIQRNWPLYITINLMCLCIIKYYAMNSYVVNVLFYISLISVVCLAVILYLFSRLNIFYDCLSNDCYLFGRAEELCCTRVYISDAILRSELRSRYAKISCFRVPIA